MAEPQPEVKIRFVKKKGGHAGPHGGAWKVAYADLVTAMMAFFLLMWLLNNTIPRPRPASPACSRIPTSSTPRRARPSSPQYEIQKTGILPGGKGMRPGTGEGGGPAVEEEQQASRSASAWRIPPRPSARPSTRQAAGDLQGPDQLRLHRRGAAHPDPGQGEPGAVRLRLLQAQALHHGHPQGDRPGAGQAAQPHGHRRAYRFPNYPPPGYTNWELSADRANAARRVLESAGVRPGRCSGSPATPTPSPWRATIPRTPGTAASPSWCSPAPPRRRKSSTRRASRQGAEQA